MNTSFSFFKSIVRLDQFIMTHGDLVKHSWHLCSEDPLPYRLLHFSVPGSLVFTAHHLDTLSIEDIRNKSPYLSVLKLEDGMYFVFKSWFDIKELDKAKALLDDDDNDTTNSSDTDSECFHSFSGGLNQEAIEEEDCPNPFLVPTEEIYFFKDFLKKCVIMKFEMKPVFVNDKVIDTPFLIFRNYNEQEERIVNFMNLTMLELLKYRDYLYIEKKESGYQLLRGNMPEEFYVDRSTKEYWKDMVEAAKKRAEARRNSYGLPEIMYDEH